MHITFGWGFDGARWVDAAATTGGLGSVTTGPAQLTDILATRLALSAPESDQPTRIAAYRAVLTRVLASADPQSWPVASFQADHWTVARELLAWRDELVRSGWDGATDPTAPRRLQVLAAVEASLAEEPGWAPGTADLLRDVDRALRDLAASNSAWPLGIEQVDVDGELADLPPVWRRILGSLSALGITVTELPAPAPLEELTVVTADTVWDAAPVAARLLKDLSDAPTRHTIVAGSSTDLLDRERVRTGQSPLGVAAREASSYAQVIPLFLRAMTTPHDIPALVGLLNTSITVDGFTSSLLPGALRSRLVGALNQQPGVGGPAWEAAVAEALEKVKDKPTSVDKITEFDKLIRENPLVVGGDGEAGYVTAQVSTHLGWLQRQFTDQGRGQSVSSNVGSRIAPLRELLEQLGERVSSRELDQVIAEFTATGGLSMNARADEVADVVTDPAHLGTGSSPVVWWLPVDTSATPRARLRPAEVEWLTNAGVVLSDPEADARLALDSQLRALRRRRSVTALTVASINGEAASQHPALTFLIDDLHRQGREPATELAELPAAHRTVPEPVTIDVPDPISRTFAAGEHLLPTRISFSQWEKLLVHPLEWLLDRRLGIRAGGLATIPSGNQMVGTWLHTVVENIVNRHLTNNAGEPVTILADRTEIGDELRLLLPWYAAELQMPGRSRELGTTLALAEESIAGLFTTLAEAGVAIRAVEASFTMPLEGSHGPDGTELELGGLRDMDVVMADGTPGVIDLKYTFARKKYRDAVQDGTALQLAVYAASVASGNADSSTQTSQPLAEIPVAYFNLRDNRLDTTDERFGAAETLTVEPSDIGAADTDELWDRAVSGLNRILDDLSAGRVTDLGNLVNVEDWQAYEKPKKNTTPVSPFDEDTTEAYERELAAARTTGFFPEKNAKYTDYPLITGATGDFS
ncbi:PD-(D/E)XK nuclease family protein [Corynebacterium sp. AOP40-9SA-29]|uniref:PD-(D/E)XK nuclease family protein n=1 Tax=Corynebacterium sp. AOP40-9SA-29 TaxID=3457677 RepID=UPI0040344028